MKILKVTYTRKFNLGNYEAEDIQLEAEVNDEDSPQTVLSALADQAFNWYLEQQRKRTETQKTLLPQVDPAYQQKVATLKPPARAGYDINQLPPDLRQHLTYKDAKIYSEYTSREKWTQINQALKDLGYEWISAGKDSHWSLKQQ